MKKRIILSIIAISLIVACGTKVAEIKDSLTKPLSPIELKVDSSTDTTVTLSWSAANTATSLLTTGYTVESATSEDFTKNSTKTTETKTTATVKNLTKGTKYYFRVVADNSKADLSSAPSNVVSHVVGADDGDGGTPSSSAAKPVLENVDLDKRASGDLTLTWTSEDGKNDDGTAAVVTKFLVRKSDTEAGLSSATAVEVAANVLTYTVEASPVGGTTYWADVQAVTANSNAAFAKSDVVVKSYTEPIYPNAHKFTYGGHTYYVVNTPKNWGDAATDARTNGGYLVHINSQAEQDAIKAAIIASGFTFDQKAADGGAARYIWTGATDTPTSDTWVWNGDNMGATEPLGTGVVSVNTMTFQKESTWATAAGAYENWGQGTAFGQNTNTPPQNEPDNHQGNQNYAAIALDNWPTKEATGQPNDTADGQGLGDAYQWNDLAGTNTMPYIVEVE